MDLKAILASIDSQIAHLQRARKALAGGEKGTGRRKMSAAARAKISRAQKKRWAKQKKEAKTKDA